MSNIVIPAIIAMATIGATLVAVWGILAWRREHVGKRRIMKCKLCQLDKKLCRSHIIPESAYKPLYDNEHRCLQISNIKKKQPMLQIGLREHLLCKECEEHLNKYDSYFADLWYQNGKAPSNANKELISINKIDYHRFKLFHMSVLWRAGVASRKEFSTVDLGLHEEKLRKLILDDNPGDPNQYAVFGYFLTSPDNRQVYQALVVPPIKFELDGMTGFCFVFGGCQWRYILASSIDIKQYPFIFQKDGSLHLLRVPIDQYNPVMNLIKERIKKGWKSRR